MKKTILLILNFLPILLFSQAIQKDIDFTFYTHKAIYYYEGMAGQKDTLNLMLHRKIEKEEDELKITSTTSTSDVKRYLIEYVGTTYLEGGFNMIYNLKDVKEGMQFKNIAINLIDPKIILIGEDSKQIYY